MDAGGDVCQCGTGGADDARYAAGLLILVGLVVASVIYAVLTNGFGLGKPIDLSGILSAA